MPKKTTNASLPKKSCDFFFCPEKKISAFFLPPQNSQIRTTCKLGGHDLIVLMMKKRRLNLIKQHKVVFFFSKKKKKFDYSLSNKIYIVKIIYLENIHPNILLVP